jgi:hypothetical protein
VASYNDKNDKPGNAILLNGAVGAAWPPAERGSVDGDFKSANREIGAPGGIAAGICRILTASTSRSTSPFISPTACPKPYCSASTPN